MKLNMVLEYLTSRIKEAQQFQKVVLWNFVVFFTPVQVLIYGIFEVLLGTFNRLSLKRNWVVYIGNPSEKEGGLLIKSEAPNITFI